MKPLRVGVVGAGHLGRIHAQKLAGMAGVALVGVADPIEAHRNAVAQAHGIQAFSEHRRLGRLVDAAVVATPTRSHHAVALDLMNAGVHLLVEKPLALTEAECAELVDAARRRALVLQVGHVERFNPALGAVLPHVGRPKYIEAIRQGGFTFRSTDIGAVLDLMIHDIDVVLALVQSPLRRVEALGLSLFGRHEDVVNARLSFANGCVAALSASRVSHTAARTMRIWSRRGFAAIDFAARSATFVRPSETLLRRELDAETLSSDEKHRLKDSLLTEHLPLEKLVVEPCDAISAELTDFTDSIRAGRAPRVTGEQGRDAVAVAARILAAMATHSWEGTADGPIGPLAQPAAAVIQAPHWGFKKAGNPFKHREAG
ncbi:MAG TPA: Gfo/Idh/MocA family oxidoreductase [Pirellulales bacterium]|nr:Gfo/Idh/MocA family oxidoreductase [Pirellulales bacterium]